jgi:hypothetical protein
VTDNSSQAQPNGTYAALTVLIALTLDKETNYSISAQHSADSSGMHASERIDPLI